MRRVWLIGGLMANDNYGDVIQAKVWIDFYLQKGLIINFVHYPEGEAAVNRNFLTVNKVKYMEFIKFLEENSFEKDEFIHMYGGGYLTKDFGSDFFKVINAVNKSKILMLVTGVQIDRYFGKKLKMAIPIINNNIKWISVRDKDSKNRLVGANPLICDDSFGYFSSREIHRKIYKLSSMRRNKVLLQLSLNEYMYDEDISKDSVIKKFKKLFDYLLKHRNKIEVVSSFDQDSNTVEEADRMLFQIGYSGVFKSISTRDIDDKVFAFFDYKYAIVNSFHTYLLLLFKFSCPVYIINLSEYYNQKVAALMEYGLLNDSNCIKNINDLITKVGQLNSNKDYTTKFKTMFERFNGVKEKVESYIL